MPLDEQVKVQSALANTPTIHRLLSAGALARLRSGAGNFVLAVRNGGDIGNGEWEFNRDGEKTVALEFLAAGKQFVSFAIHPKDGPYYWSHDCSPETAPLSALPALTAAGLEAFRAELAAALAKFGLIEARMADAARSPARGRGLESPTPLADALCAADAPLYARARRSVYAPR